MKEKKVIVNGKEETICVELPEEMREDYIDPNIEKTIELNEVIEEVKEKINSEEKENGKNE